VVGVGGEEEGRRRDGRSVGGGRRWGGGESVVGWAKAKAVMVMVMVRGQQRGVGLPQDPTA
jgi:hypothetical protein